LHVDGSPHVIRSDEPLYGTSMPGAGAVHHIKGGTFECQLSTRLVRFAPKATDFDAVQRSAASCQKRR